jgi:hypothetical protein
MVWKLSSLSGQELKYWRERSQQSDQDQHERYGRPTPEIDVLAPETQAKDDPANHKSQNLKNDLAR